MLRFIKNIFNELSPPSFFLPSVALVKLGKRRLGGVLINESDILFGFWKDLSDRCKNENRPMMVLAPMADVTDVAFRYMLNKYGKPDVTWTEFVAANGLMSPGREVLKRDLEYSEIERPIVAQLFTNDPINMEGAARLCLEMGFDGIDINMGCPVNVIGKQGAGAKLITEPKLAMEIIRAAQRGAKYFDPDTGEHIKEKSIPVSVKTRIGFNKIEYKTWLPAILECGLPTLSLHLRTRKEMSSVLAHYELIDDIYNLVKKISPATNFIINGDIKSVAQANEMHKKYKFDGAMIGRGVFGAPWTFAELKKETGLTPELEAREGEKQEENENKIRHNKTCNKIDNKADISLQEKLIIMLEHTKLFQEKLGDIKSFAIMKKHYKAYVNGFDGAADLRALLFATNNYEEVEKVVRDFVNKLD